MICEIKNTHKRRSHVIYINMYDINNLKKVLLLQYMNTLLLLIVETETNIYYLFLFLQLYTTHDSVLIKVFIFIFYFCRERGEVSSKGRQF